MFQLLRVLLHERGTDDLYPPPAGRPVDPRAAAALHGVCGVSARRHGQERPLLRGRRGRRLDPVEGHGRDGVPGLVAARREERRL